MVYFHLRGIEFQKRVIFSLWNCIIMVTKRTGDGGHETKHEGSTGILYFCIATLYNKFSWSFFGRFICTITYYFCFVDWNSCKSWFISKAKVLCSTYRHFNHHFGHNISIMVSLSSLCRWLLHLLSFNDFRIIHCILLN